MLHGIVKKTATRYKYYLTAAGLAIAATVLRLREMFVVPTLHHNLLVAIAVLPEYRRIVGAMQAKTQS